MKRETFVKRMIDLKLSKITEYERNNSNNKKITFKY